MSTSDDWTVTNRIIGRGDPNCLHCSLQRFMVRWVQLHRPPAPSGVINVDSDLAITNLCAVIADLVNSTPEPGRAASERFARNMLQEQFERRQGAGGVGHEVVPAGAQRH